MNNKNKILVGCLALLLVLSVGYAYFSDTITITGTATAKGNFDITTTCDPGLTSKLGTAESLGLPKEGGYKNDSCSVVDDTVSFQAEFEYLTAVRYFTVKLTNNGSIDSSVNIDEISNAVKNATATQACLIDKSTGEETCDQADNLFLTNIFALMPAATEDKEGNFYIGDEVSKFVDSNGENIILKPGQSLYVIAVANIPDAANEAEQALYDKYYIKYSFSSKFTFNQVTN